MKIDRLHPVLPIVCCLLSSCTLEDGISDRYQCLDDHYTSINANAMSKTKCDKIYKCQQGDSDDPEFRLHLCYRCDDINQRFNTESQSCEDFACQNDEYSCRDNEVMICENGTLRRIASCTNGMICNATDGTCIASETKCENGKYRCEGQILKYCQKNNEIDVSVCEENTKCSAEQGKCVAPDSKCVETPFRCDGKFLLECIDGEFYEIETCANENACDAENHQCKDVCTENAYSCTGQILMQCRNGEINEIKTCTDDEICDSNQGQCTAKPSSECSAENEGSPCTGPDTPEACEQYVCRSGSCKQEPRQAGTICRSAAGICDIAETCDGILKTCPQDSFKPAGTVCHDKQHTCDEPETCNGSSAECPALQITNKCVCPKFNTVANGYNLKEGSGVHAFKNGSDDYAGFILKDTNTWAENADIIKTLGSRIDVTQLTFNRSMTTFDIPYTGKKKGYHWESGDLNVEYWTPQGCAGGSRDGIDLKVASWNYEEGKESGFSGDKGVRVSIINTSDSSNLTYRHVLLAEPTRDAAKLKIVSNSAGGLVWSWPYLYETDTSNGLRVFDMTQILIADTSTDCKTHLGLYNGKLCAFGAKYILPQVNYYQKVMGTNCSDFRFSFAGIERRTEGNSLLAGEYIKYNGNENTCMYSRLIRYPFGSGGKLKTTNGYVEPIGGWFTGNCNIQGGSSVVINAREFFLLTSSRNYGRLYRSTGNGDYYKEFTASGQETAYLPQGMYITTKDNAWIITQSHNSAPRSLYYVNALSLLP